MGKIPNPFSLYDFLGYFFPGAIVVYCIALMWGHADPNLSVQYVYDRFLSFKDPGMVLPLILFAYVLGHLASYLSSVTVEYYSKVQYGQPSTYILGHKHRPYFFGTIRERFDLLHFILGIFMLPVALFDLGVGRGLNLARVYTRGLDKIVRDVVRQNMIERLGAIGHPRVKAEEARGEVIEFFLLLQHYALENCEHHRPKMDNYVALYGFLRTITFIMILLAWIALGHVMLVGSTGYLPYGTPLALSALAFLFYMAYMKFWRRYSLEVLMAVAVSRKPEPGK